MLAQCSPDLKHIDPIRFEYSLQGGVAHNLPFIARVLEVRALDVGPPAPE